MKKLDIISFFAIVIAIIGLVLLKITGMTGHIVISIIALLIMVVCTILGRKDWKVPILEILYRLFYLVALITGIVMIQAHIFGPVSIIHKASAAIFAAIYIINFILKIKASK